MTTKKTLLATCIRTEPKLLLFANFALGAILAGMLFVHLTQGGGWFWLIWDVAWFNFNLAVIKTAAFNTLKHEFWGEAIEKRDWAACEWAKDIGFGDLMARAFIAPWSDVRGLLDPKTDNSRFENWLDT